MANQDHSGFVFEEGLTRAVTSVSSTPTTSGNNNEIVAAQAAGIKIRVLAVIIHGMTAGDTLVFKSATTAISPTFVVAAGATIVLPYNPHGWWTTAAAAALNLDLTTGNDIGLTVTWCTAS